MSTGPCEAVPTARDCQLKKMVVVRLLVPKGLRDSCDPGGVSVGSRMAVNRTLSIEYSFPFCARASCWRHAIVFCFMGCFRVSASYLYLMFSYFCFVMLFLSFVIFALFLFWGGGGGVV